MTLQTGGLQIGWGCNGSINNQSGDHWRGRYLGIVGLVETAFHQGAGIRPAIVVLMRGGFAMVATGEELQAGEFFELTVKGRRHPQGYQGHHQDCFEPLHAGLE